MASKQWTLTRPDGKCWTGETPLKCVMAEVNDRVPASVQLERIYGAVEKSRADDERLCRQTYENTFHKITASIGYDDWHMVWFKALDAIDGAESQPTQAPAATEAPSDWDANPDGIVPGQESGPRMNSETGFWEGAEADEENMLADDAVADGRTPGDSVPGVSTAALVRAVKKFEGRAGSTPANSGEMIAPGQTARGGAPHPIATPAPAVGASVQPVQASLIDEQIDALVDDFKAAARAKPTAVNGYGLRIWDDLKAKLRALASSTLTKGGAS